MTTIHPWQWTMMCHYASSARQAGNIVSHLLQVMATPPHRQLTRHAYPGQPSKHLPRQCPEESPSTGLRCLREEHHTGGHNTTNAEPWPGEDHRPHPEPTPLKACTCWYAYLCCGLMVDRPADHQLLAEYGYNLGHSATGFIINPQCPHHGLNAAPAHHIATATITARPLPWEDTLSPDELEH